MTVWRPSDTGRISQVLYQRSDAQRGRVHQVDVSRNLESGRTAFADGLWEAEEGNLAPIRRPIRAISPPNRATIIARIAAEQGIEPPLSRSVPDGGGDGRHAIASQVGDGSTDTSPLGCHSAVAIRIEAEAARMDLGLDGKEWFDRIGVGIVGDCPIAGRRCGPGGQVADLHNA